MPKRLIDSSVFSSPDLAGLSPIGLLVWIGLLVHADDEGYVCGDPTWLLHCLFKNTSRPPRCRVIAASLSHLERVTVIKPYDRNGVKYYQIKNWKKHQRLSRPSESTRREEKRTEEKRKEEDDVPQGSTTPRFDWSPHRERWNAIAAEQGLPALRGPLHQRRRQKLQARLKESPTFWEEIIPELRRRGRWARENRFPTFDQLLEPRILTKLLEGNYRPTPAEQRQDEDAHSPEVLRQGLVRKLWRHEGKTLPNGQHVGRAVVTSASGYERPYKDLTLSELEQLIRTAEHE